METGGGIAGSSLQVEGSSGQRRKIPASLHGRFSGEKEANLC
jgi:hypothetical protein